MEKYSKSNSITCSMLSSNCAAALEIQITREFGAAYDYFSKYAWFSRPDVAFEGFASYFYHSSNEEKLHAKQLVQYILLRYTCNPIGFVTISAARPSSWHSITEATQYSGNKREKLKIAPVL